MHALSTASLLDVWEDGLSRPLAQRAIELLAAAYPESSRESYALLSIGQRDARLMSLREELWGPRMLAVVACPACRERLELALDVREFRSGYLPEQNGSNSLEVAGYSVTFRLPNSQDFSAAASNAESPELCHDRILQGCLLSATHEDLPVTSDQLPPEVITALAESIAKADPLADIQLALNCASCGESWSAAFDIVSYLWTEIEVWVWKILADVHTLARAYAWRESDILNLSPMRRQFYLERVSA
jgi:uncharacterized protein YbaR (Trm112 family)